MQHQKWAQYSCTVCPNILILKDMKRNVLQIYSFGSKKSKLCAKPLLNGVKYYWILFNHTIPVKTTVLQKRMFGPNFKTIGQHYFATSRLEQ